MATSNCTKTARGYIRVSTEEQAASGLGLEAQRERIRAYCEAKGLKLVRLYEDPGVSGGKPLHKRPAGAELLTDTRKTKCVVVTAKFDRLFRSVRDAANTIADFDQRGIELVAIAEGFDMTNHYGRAMAQMAIVFAELEKAMISERTRTALAAYRRGRRVSKRLQKMYPEGVPEEIVKAQAGKLGAELPQCRSNLSDSARRKGRRLGAASSSRLADEAYAHVGQLVHDLRASGQTLTAIADTLNRDGYSTRRGRAWNPMQVSRVLDRHNGNGKVT